jgi:hypothetical protein
MNLRHIDPRSTDWMDAMMEGEGGRTRKREPQDELVDAQGNQNPALLVSTEAQAQMIDREAPRSPPRVSRR